MTCDWQVPIMWLIRHINLRRGEGTRLITFPAAEFCLVTKALNELNASEQNTPPISLSLGYQLIKKKRYSTFKWVKRCGIGGKLKTVSRFPSPTDAVSTVLVASSCKLRHCLIQDGGLWHALNKIRSEFLFGKIDNFEAQLNVQIHHIVELKYEK